MPAHNEHHFIPESFLAKWHVPQPDPRFGDQLVAFTWAQGRLLSRRRRARGLAKLAGLYSLRGVTEDVRNSVERLFFQRIDNDAAIAHQALIAGDIGAMTDEVGNAWIRFLVSLTIRLPHTVNHYRASAPTALSRQFEGEQPPEFQTPEFLDWYEATKDDHASNITLGAVRKFIEESALHHDLVGLEWIVRDLSVSNCDLVLGDDPLVRHGSLAQEHLYALPISPTKLFMAHSNRATLERIVRAPADEIVRRTNRDSAMRSQRWLFSTGFHHEGLARRYLQRS